MRSFPHPTFSAPSASYSLPFHFDRQKMGAKRRRFGIKSVSNGTPSNRGTIGGRTTKIFSQPLSFAFNSFLFFVRRNTFVQYEEIARLWHWNRRVDDNDQSIGLAAAVSIVVIIIIVNGVHVNANRCKVQQLLCQLLAGKIYCIAFRYSAHSAKRCTHPFSPALVRSLRGSRSFSTVLTRSRPRTALKQQLQFFLSFSHLVGTIYFACVPLSFCCVNCFGHNKDIHRTTVDNNNHTQLNAHRLDCHRRFHSQLIIFHFLCIRILNEQPEMWMLN